MAKTTSRNKMNTTENIEPKFIQNVEKISLNKILANELEEGLKIDTFIAH